MYKTRFIRRSHLLLKESSFQRTPQMAASCGPSIFLMLLFLHALCFLFAHGEVHNFVFVLKETNFTRLCLTKSILTVNDSFPGPEIRVRRGDTAFVNVYNQGNYSVTIHWHGIKQPRNPWSDGPEYITQCGIPAGTNFTYEVEFTEEEGTLFWHAHSDWTRATVHGAIVILPPLGQTFPFPKFDGENVIVLGSWYKEDLRLIVEHALETGGEAPRSNAFTINGFIGKYSNCPNEKIYRMVVEQGKTYLLRVINAAVNSDLFFAIAEHNLTVIGSDGAYVKPIPTNYIMISAGKTMDVLVTANQSSGSYYMVSRQYSSQGTSPEDYFDKFNVTAIFQYEGDDDPSTSPIFPTSTLPIYKDYEAASVFQNRFRSLGNEKYPVDVPKNITTRMFVTLSMGAFEICPNSSCTEDLGTGICSSLSNHSWMNPFTDVLHAYYWNISGVYSTDFPDEPPTYYNFTAEDVPTVYDYPKRDTQVKVLEYNEEVEIVFQDTNVVVTGMSHPMHLHGHSFYVVGMGYGNFDEQVDAANYNLVDPPYMNTVGVPRFGWATIRFYARNPGVWFLHCHLDKHQSWGMNTVFVVKNGGTPETSMRPPPAYMPHCNSSLTNPFLHLKASDTKPDAALKM